MNNVSERVSVDGCKVVCGVREVVGIVIFK